MILIKQITKSIIFEYYYTEGYDPEILLWKLSYNNPIKTLLDATYIKYK